MRINEQIVIGFDLGIASVGWSLFQLNENQTVNHLLDAGVWLFNAPETDKEKKPTNQIRREARLTRRTISRRRQRLNEVRACLAFYHLLPHKHKFAQTEVQQNLLCSPWDLRVEGLDRVLSKEELGIALYHIAKHRGFKLTRKGGEKAEAKNDQKLLSSLASLSSTIANYRTFAEALVMDADLKQKKRNREGDYGRTPKRDWLVQEVIYLLERQRQLGNHVASKELEEDFIAKAFSQRGLQNSITLLGQCSFEPQEKRASKYAPSYELFRFLSKLNNLQLKDEKFKSRSLRPDEIAKAMNEFGKQQSFTYKKLRTILAIPDTVHFKGLVSNKKSKEDEEKQDIVTSKGKSAPGTCLFRKLLGEIYPYVSMEQLDQVTEIIAFHEDSQTIKEKIAQLKLDKDGERLIVRALDDNHFEDFKGVGHLSTKACRNLIPYLKQGFGYTEACENVGYDFLAPDNASWVNLKNKTQGLSPSLIRKVISEHLTDKKEHLVTSPVARKAVIEGIKQFVALINNHPALQGQLPGFIHVELARDLGQNVIERNKLSKIIKEGTERNRTLERNFLEDFPEQKATGSSLRLYALAQEQGWKCLYSGDSIQPEKLFDGISYQIDHILPWSRFGDDSFHNLTLCTAKANQAKKNRTPFEWMQEDPHQEYEFSQFAYRVETCSSCQRKKRGNICCWRLPK